VKNEASFTLHPSNFFLLTLAKPKKAWPFILDYDNVFIMTTKERVIQSLNDLPNDASIEDAMERLLFLAKIDRGLKQADAGQTIPHSQVKERMAKWLK